MGSTPNIRFNGYRDDWEQHALGELYTERNERGNDSLQILSVSIHSGVSDGELDEENLGKVVRRSEDKSTYKHVYEGDLIFNMMRAWQGAIGVAKSEGMISPAYISAIPCKNLYPPFMNYLLRREETIGQINNLSYGITDFRKRLYWDSFVKVVCNVPSTSEQKRIASFFESLDALIILHQDKFNHAQKLKKYMLQKMFPQKDQSVPEIRFAGFTDAWEQRKLGECLTVATKRNGNSYTKEDVLSVSDEYGCVNQIQFQGRSFAGNDISNYKIAEDGDIIYTRSPLQAKPYGIIKVMRGNPGVVSPLYIVNKPTEGNDSEFLYRVFDTPAKTNNYLCALVRKGAKNTMNISEDEWLSGNIMVAPTHDEQHKIGQFFNQIDKVITLHQRKCDELAELKKYMLQNMFPKKEG